MDILDVEARPPRLQAVQVTADNVEEVAEWARTYFSSYKPLCVYLEGDDVAYLGDWIVYNSRKDKYKVFKDGEFQERYAKVVDE